MRQEVEAFDQAHIEMIDRAVEAAWNVVSKSDVIRSAFEERNLMARCVLHQFKVGEENFIRIVNTSILDFRRHRAAMAVRERQAKVQAS